VTFFKPQLRENGTLPKRRYRSRFYGSQRFISLDRSGKTEQAGFRRKIAIPIRKVLVLIEFERAKTWRGFYR
jgi:hypothetical protein